MPQFISEDRCQNMINETLKDYERQIVEPRHKETQGELGEIKTIVSQGRGAIWTIGIVFTLIMAAFEIYRAINR